MLDLNGCSFQPVNETSAMHQLFDP